MDPSVKGRRWWGAFVAAWMWAPAQAQDLGPPEERAPPTPDGVDVPEAPETGPADTPQLPNEVVFRYHVVLRPPERVAEVRLRVEQQGPGLKQLRLHFEPDQHMGFEGDGVLEPEDETHLMWQPPPQGGKLNWTARLDHLRDPKSYDARMSTRWALFRGTDLVPPSASKFVSGSTSRGTVRFEIPKRWQILTVDPETSPGRFTIQSDRFFVRPRGWMMAGRLNTLKFETQGVQFTLATPRKLGLDLMDLRTFFRFTMPVFSDLITELPERILVVGAGDPMWRGGLSGPDSLYLHADRPLVSPDGTSPVLHELLHVLMEAKAEDDGDWVVEGLAELYALNVLHRAGGMSEPERDAAIEKLRARGRKVQTLRAPSSSGRRTAKAVGVLDRLDRRIRQVTDGTRSLDDVLRTLAKDGGRVSTARFETVVSEVTGRDMAPFFETHVAKTP